MTDLLPCPFCGGEPSKIASHVSVEAEWQIRCDHDECLGPHTTAGTEQDAVVQWNSRVQSSVPAQAEQVTPIYQMMATDDDEGAGKDVWMDVTKEVFDDLKRRDDVRSRVLYLAAQPPAAPVEVSDASYCPYCDLEYELHEDAQGFHHVIKGERVECCGGLAPAAPVETEENGMAAWQEAYNSRLVDWTYLHATEGQTWPSTKTKQVLIARARQDVPTQDHADGMKAAAPQRSSAGSAFERWETEWPDKPFGWEESEARLRLLDIINPVPQGAPDSEVFRKLLRTAQLLQQNSEGCAVNHHGLDFEQQGLPGWLADTQKAIDEAALALSRPQST